MKRAAGLLDSGSFVYVAAGAVVVALIWALRVEHLRHAEGIAK